ncbi:alkaline shock response membrane anchor protein AmaP [Saccharopolyspora sp. TS4A08]|uniref:Alkaline shock response membrane anchor protein AmaP n=1 Tax=Saccharopolyspora ipomoeae TaxID=3042027 RepID=A0ABT6PLQ9_9PSEU|nr:alkaline shock response membrane anchor protein AmaP [Saccharopolyspora sp. TS4A08]MDI2028869.1 alkaline shock response membrane anchor protein AmaP [Saccharopolyspora sp. TS4A08]
MEQVGGPVDDARPSSTPVGRSLGFERSLLIVLAFVLLAAGASALVVGLGLLGRFRAERPVLDPVLQDWVGANRVPALAAGVALGVLLVVLGGWWVLRSLRPERRPDVLLADESGGSAIVTAVALANAVRDDAEQVTGVSSARVRMAGTENRPHLRLALSLQEGADVRGVWAELDEKVLARARRALEAERLPAAVHFRLERAAGRRVT